MFTAPDKRRRNFMDIPESPTERINRGIAILDRNPKQISLRILKIHRSLAHTPSPDIKAQSLTCNEGKCSGKMIFGAPDQMCEFWKIDVTREIRFDIFHCQVHSFQDIHDLVPPRQQNYHTGSCGMATNFAQYYRSCRNLTEKEKVPQS